MRQLLRSPLFIVSAIYLSGRVVTTAMLLYFMGQPGQIGFDGSAVTNFITLSNSFDAGWYRQITESGYPSLLVFDSGGHLKENAWAFMPVFPMLVGVLSSVSGLAWPVSSVVVSVLCGWGTSLLLFKILDGRISRGQAFFAVALFCLAPVSPLLQFGYAESLFLLLLASVLYLLQHRRYFLTMPLILLLAFTKPGVLAISLTLVLLWGYRMYRRKAQPFPARQSVGLFFAAVTAGISGLAWIFIADAVTGVPGTYLQTELVWRSASIGWAPLVPFTPWIQGVAYWGTKAGIPVLVGFVGLALMLILAIIVLISKPMKRLGIEIQLWLVSFSLYIFAVFFPQSSTFRILMPLFPGLGFLAQPQSKVYRIGLVAAFLIGQWIWIDICWVPPALAP